MEFDNLYDCNWTKCGRKNCIRCYPKNSVNVEPGTVIETPDLVYKPKHYAVAGDTEAIDIIRLVLRQMPELTPYQGYCLGNLLKYRLRAVEKDALQQDIDKANVYKEWFNETCI